MNPVTHFLISWSIADRIPFLSRGEKALISLSGVIPDIDGIGIIPELLTKNSDFPLTWFSDYHHVVSHNLLSAFLISSACAFFSRNRAKIFLWCFICFILHLFCDLAGSGGPEGENWGIPWFYPFYDQFSCFSWQWQLNAWPNQFLNAFFLFNSLNRATGKGHSFLCLFSEKCDRHFVHALITLKKKLPFSGSF